MNKIRHFVFARLEAPARRNIIRQPADRNAAELS
jgi:hypothetical protein